MGRYFGIFKEYSTGYAAFDRIGPDGQITATDSYRMSEVEFKSVSPRMRNSIRLVITVIRLRLTHRYSP